MPAFPSPRPLEPARRQALLTRVAATTEATLALEAQLASPDPGGPGPVDPDQLLVPAARALLGVLHRAGGGELLVSLASDSAWAVRVRDGAGGPTVELVPTDTADPAAFGPATGDPATAGAPTGDEDGVPARLAALLRSGGTSR